MLIQLFTVTPARTGQLKGLFPKTSKTVLKLIETHHENFDGSGFSGASGNFITHGARVLRIVDDVAIQMRSKKALTFKDALSSLILNNLTKYDLSIIQKIHRKYMEFGLEI